MSKLTRMSRALTALSAAALCAVVQGYAAPAWSEARPPAASDVGSSTLPAGPPATVISLQILERDMPKVPNGKYVIRPTSAGSVGHLSMSHPALWADQSGAFMSWLNSD